MAAAVESAQAVPHRADTGEDVTVGDQLPSLPTLEACSSVSVYGKDGKAQAFKSLYAGPGKHLIIFVRHFFCGMCQDFLRSLVASLSPEDLTNLPTPTTLSVIGCGDPALLKDYIHNTNFTFPIYADPSRELYDTLGMTSNLSQGPKKPDYQTSSLMGVVGKSFMQAISSGPGAFKGGKQSQNGGEFLIENGEVTWCHRMRNTRDHTEIPILREKLGFQAL